MKLHLEGIPPPLWQRVARARHRLLMLDYDGTLAPLRAARAEAVPAPGARELLAALAVESHTTAAIVSGRPVTEIERLIGPLSLTLVGEHGWEERRPDGVVIRAPLSADAKALLDRAERLARDRGAGAALERKRTGVMLHTRGMPPALAREREREIASSWGPLVAASGAVVDFVSGGVEVRMHERHKGTAAQSLIARSPAGTLAVYVGDDVTDEDAFHAVREHGIGIRVGAPDRETAATAWLPTPAALVPFLEEWLRHARAGAAAPSE